MAADSAVTIEINGDRKIYQSANKIFSLSKKHPVGIMIHGNSKFMDIQWETVIKLYRSQLGSNHFPTVEDYAKDFFKFLCKHREISKLSRQQDYMRRLLVAAYTPIRNSTMEHVQERVQEVKQLSRKEILEIFRETVAEFHEVMDGAPELQSIRGTKLTKTQLDKIGAAMKPIIAEARKVIFEKLPTDAALSRRLNTIGQRAFTRMISFRPDSGVVIAGYGDDEVFPAVAAYAVSGMVAGTMKMHAHKVAHIDEQVSAMVIPFAQSEMVYAFMQGVDPQLSEKTIELFADSIDEIVEAFLSTTTNSAAKAQISDKLHEAKAAILDHLSKTLEAYGQEHFVQPIISMVASLPKVELASMAETLVNLTSFKRRISTDAETVGGPIDVALISKGDGLVWVNRKHYFDKDLNYHFFMNYSDEQRSDE